MALVGIALETIDPEPDALTTRPPPCAIAVLIFYVYEVRCVEQFDSLVLFSFMSSFCSALINSFTRTYVNGSNIFCLICGKFISRNF